MSANRSKAKKGPTWFSWLGSFFLWFVTPTKASALWDKWLKEKEEDETPRPKE